MRDKLQHLIDSEENLTNSGFAKMLGIQPATISHLLAGRNKPSYELLQKILLRFPNVSSDWLMLDRGEMLRDASLTPSGMPRANGAAGGTENVVRDVAFGTYGANSAADVMTAESAAPDSGIRQSTIFDTPLFAGSSNQPAGTQPSAGNGHLSPREQTLRESNISDAQEPAAVWPQSHAVHQVERVVVFYTDKTFETYLPKK